MPVRLLLELAPLLLVTGVVALLMQRNRLTARERLELANLRTFKNTVHTRALDEIEIDSASLLARVVLDEVRQVDLANHPATEELS